jgi:hypothetical protein
MIKTIFPTYEDTFLKFKELAEKQKKEESESTFEGKLITAVVAENELVEVGTLFLSTEQITGKINEGRPERYFYSADTIGAALRGLGFKMKRDSQGVKRGIEFDLDLIKSLADQFNVDTKDLGVHASQMAEVSDEEIETKVKAAGLI